MAMKTTLITLSFLLWAGCRVEHAPPTSSSTDSSANAGIAVLSDGQTENAEEGSFDLTTDAEDYDYCDKEKHWDNSRCIDYFDRIGGNPYVANPGIPRYESDSSTYESDERYCSKEIHKDNQRCIDFEARVAGFRDDTTEYGAKVSTYDSTMTLEDLLREGEISTGSVDPATEKAYRDYVNRNSREDFVRMYGGGTTPGPTTIKAEVITPTSAAYAQGCINNPNWTKCVNDCKANRSLTFCSAVEAYQKKIKDGSTMGGFGAPDSGEKFKEIYGPSKNTSAKAVVNKAPMEKTCDINPIYPGCAEKWERDCTQNYAWGKCVTYCQRFKSSRACVETNKYVEGKKAAVTKTNTSSIPTNKVGTKQKVCGWGWRPDGAKGCEQVKCSSSQTLDSGGKKCVNKSSLATKNLKNKCQSGFVFDKKVGACVQVLSKKNRNITTTNPSGTKVVTNKPRPAQNKGVCKPGEVIKGFSCVKAPAKANGPRCPAGKVWKYMNGKMGCG
jgi:hypothetical protein